MQYNIVKKRNFYSLIFIAICSFLLLINIVIAQESNYENGVALYEADDYSNAYDTLDLALDDFRDASDRIGEANALYYMGLAKYAQGEYVPARDLHFNPAWNIYTEQGETAGIVRALWYIAKCGTANGNYADSSGLYGSALTQAQNANLNNLAANILIDKGNNYIALSWKKRSDDNLANQPDSYVIEQVNSAESDIHRAIDDYKNAIDLYIVLQDTEQHAEALVLRAKARWMLYDTDAAIFDLEDASLLFVETGNQQRQADVLLLAANIRNYAGDFVTALADLNQADPILQQINDEIGYNRSLALRGYISFQQNFPDAEQQINSALIGQRQIGDNDGRMVTLRYLGEYYLANGEYNQAHNHFDESLNIALSNDDLSAEAWAFFGRGLARAQGSIGELRFALNDLDYGMLRFRDYLRDVRSFRYINNLQAQFFLSRQEYRTSDGGEGAIQLLEDSLNRSRSINDLKGQAESNIQLGEAYVIMARDPGQNAREFTPWGDFIQALIYMRTAADLYARNNDYQSQGYVLLRIGDLQLLTGRTEQAGSSYDNALVSFTTAQDPIGQAQTYTKQARIAYLNGSERIAYQLLLDADVLLQDGNINPLAETLVRLAQSEVQMNLGLIYLDAEMFEQASQAFTEAESTQLQYGSPLAYLTTAYRGNLELIRGNTSSARSIYNQVLSSSGNPQASAIASRGLGIISGNTGDLINMRDYFEDALGHSREIHDQVGEFDTFMAQGYVYLGQKDIANAEALFASAEDSAIGINNTHERALAEYAFSQLFIQKIEDQNRIGISVRYANDALFHANQTGDTRLRIDINMTLGRMYLNQSDFDNASVHFNEGRELALQEGYLLQESIARVQIATIYYRKRQFTLALNALNIAQNQVNCLADDIDTVGSDCDLFSFDEASINPLIDSNNINIVRGVINRQFGEVYVELGQYSEANTSFTDSETMLSTFANEYTQADIELGYTQSAIGGLDLIQRDFSSAGGRFENAGFIAERHNDLAGIALANYGLGRTYTVDSDPSNDEQGLDLLNLAIVDFRSGALNARLLQESFVAQANYFMEQGDIEEASTMYYQAISDAQASRDTIGEGNINLLLGDLYRDTFQFVLAENVYSDAERIFDRYQSPLRQGEALNRLGMLNVLRVNYRDALENFNEMFLIYDGENNTIGIARSYNAIGRVYYLQARYARALESHTTALNILQSQSEVVDELIDETESVTLEERFFEALTINTEMETYHQISIVRLALADFVGSQVALNEATDRAINADNQIKLTDLTLLNGQLLYAQGRDNYMAAQAEFERVIRDYTDRDEGIALGNANIELGLVLIGLADAGLNRFDNLDDAEEAYTVVQREAVEAGDLRMRIEAWLGFGRVYNRQNNDTLAEDNLFDALRNAELINSEELLISIHIELGLLYEERGDSVQAESYFLNAIELIESVHSVMRIQTGQANFFAQNNLPYQHLVDYYIEIGQDEKAFEYAERGRSRTFIYHANREQLDFGENASSQSLEEWRSINALLSDKYGQQNDILAEQESDTGNTNLATQLQAIEREITQLQQDVERLQSSIELQETVLSQVVYVNTPSLDDIRQSIDPGTTMIAYYVAQTFDTNHIYAFVITSEGYQPVALDSIQNLRGQVFNAVDARRSIDNFAINELSGILISSLVNHDDTFVQEAMTNENWIIAPHSALNVLPFTALIQVAKPESETYLQYTPSASFYVALRNRLSNIPAITSQSPALVFGNPTNDNSSFASLDWAKNEAETVASLFGTSEFVEDRADERLFVEQARNYDVIHIAAHGVIESDNPLSSYLLLSNDTDGAYDGRLEVREIYTLQLQNRSPLVVLSACETNIDNLVDGDEFQGLARAFLVSGARGVVASLWSVDDEATSVLMETFHQYVAQGDHPSVALTKAQVDVRNNPDRDWQAANYWAGFVYIGA